MNLRPGESKQVAVELDQLALSIFDAERHRWQRAPGDYTIMVGGSSQNLPLQERISLKEP